MTPDDIKKINELISERDRLTSGLKSIDGEHKKVAEWPVKVGDGGSYGHNHVAHLTLTREQIVYHIKERLFHVELALKTYGVEA